jgi:hypothetical protein
MPHKYSGFTIESPPEKRQSVVYLLSVSVVVLIIATTQLTHGQWTQEEHAVGQTTPLGIPFSSGAGRHQARLFTESPEAGNAVLRL